MSPARAVVAQDLQLDELNWLFGVLVGAHKAGALIEALVEFVDTGVEETWYEAQLRRKYGGSSSRSRTHTVCTRNGMSMCSPRPVDPSFARLESDCCAAAARARDMAAES